MKNKIRLCLLLILFSTSGFAQDEGSYDPYLSNPSLGGYLGLVKVGSIYQTEMTAYDNHPRKLLLWGSSAISNRVSGGFKLASQEAGVLRNLNGELSFIYGIPIGSSKIAFGLSGTINQLSLMRDKVKVIDPGDPMLLGSESGEWFSANTGVSISKVNLYYVGLSAYNLIPKKTDWMVNSFKSKNELLYVLSGMYTFSFFEGKFLWEWIAIVNTSKPGDIDYLNYAVSNKVFFLKDFWLETGYVNESTFKGGAGINIQNVSFSYGGYYSFGSVAKHNYPFTKHEVSLIIKLPYSKSSKTNGVGENYY